MMIMTMIMATTRRSEPAAPSQLSPMQPPTPPFGCVRKYDSALAVSSARRQYEQDVVRAFRAEHVALAVGNASLASALSLNEIRRRGSAQKRHFLRRFSSVGRAAPVPGLSIGCVVADYARKRPATRGGACLEAALARAAPAAEPEVQPITADNYAAAALAAAANPHPPPA
jgi:hypothetical protein